MTVIVAIDGPSGVGKSSTSKAVARRLHIPHIDTGARYRAIALKAVRQQIASAVNLILQVTRLSDGSRRVTSISEITGMEQDVITMHEIFTFERTGVGENGAVKGRFKATGIRPKCSQQLVASGVPLPMEMFEHVKLVA